MTIELYGASDDLIELEGDICEEFYALNIDASDDEDTDGGLICFSDGTILRILYTNSGVWRIAPVVQGTAVVSIAQAPEDDEDNYTDRATIDGEIRWAALANEWAGTK